MPNRQAIADLEELPDWPADVHPRQGEHRATVDGAQAIDQHKNDGLREYKEEARARKWQLFYPEPNRQANQHRVASS